MKAAAIGLAVALLGAGSTANVHRTVEYDSNTPLVIECPATLICSIDLEPGETVTPKIVGGSLQLFDPQILYAGSQPHFMLHPDAPGRRGNFFLATTGLHPHLYEIMAVSTKADLPMMRVSFRYDAEDRHEHIVAATAARVRAQRQLAQARTLPTPAPLAVALDQRQMMDAACAANHEVYQRDRGAFSPARVCHTDHETYIELPPSATARPDIPVVMELTQEGDRVADSHYDDGVYRVMDVADQYVLIQGKTRIRIVRAVPETAAK